MTSLTNQEKIDYLTYSINFFKSSLDLEKIDLNNLIEINSHKVEYVRNDILNKQARINALENALEALTSV